MPQLFNNIGPPIHMLTCIHTHTCTHRSHKKFPEEKQYQVLNSSTKREKLNNVLKILRQ